MFESREGTLPLRRHAGALAVDAGLDAAVLGEAGIVPAVLVIKSVLERSRASIPFCKHVGAQIAGRSAGSAAGDSDGTSGA